MNSSKVRLYGAVAAAVLLAAAGGYGLSTLQNRGAGARPRATPPRPNTRKKAARKRAETSSS